MSIRNINRSSLIKLFYLSNPLKVKLLESDNTNDSKGINIGAFVFSKI